MFHNSPQRNHQYAIPRLLESSKHNINQCTHNCAVALPRCINIFPLSKARHYYDYFVHHLPIHITSNDNKEKTERIKAINNQQYRNITKNTKRKKK